MKIVALTDIHGKYKIAADIIRNEKPDVVVIGGDLTTVGTMKEASDALELFRRECATLAHASKRALVTVERVVEGNFLEDERLAAGAINATYIESIAIAERGAHPVALLDEYGFDAAYVAEYARMAKTDEGFAAWLARHVFGSAEKAAAE